MKRKALGMNLDGDIICVACAKEQAERIPYAELFWISNKFKKFDTTKICNWCGNTLKSDRALNATDKLIEKYGTSNPHNDGKTSIR